MEFNIKKSKESDYVVALAGNPNVGKSTVFNMLTGLKQHTGNWPGKTVSNTQGICRYHDKDYIMVDIPGTYSLMSHSKEEEIARDFLCFGSPDAVIVVCDATCLERNLNLVLQTIEITDHVIVCVNLMDEASRKNISLNLPVIAEKLGVPVIAASARNGCGLNDLMNAVEQLLSEVVPIPPIRISYIEPIEQTIETLAAIIHKKEPDSKISPRWAALKLLEKDKDCTQTINEYLSLNFDTDQEWENAYTGAQNLLASKGITDEVLKDSIVSCLVQTAENICSGTVSFHNKNYNAADRKIDKFLTNKITGFPIMIALLCVVFWLTITGANIPSALIANWLFSLQDKMAAFCIWIGIPSIIYEVLIFGVYRVVAWVISVMLPPMAIFFPLFTLLEDFGYLPRVAFNMDKTFKKCCACGKQALTMCMGFGCNAAGIVGCRIIDSPRERLIAIITNSFVPCNGRFPTLIAIITMFFTYSAAAPFQSLLGAVLLTLIVLLGIVMTFFVSKLLSKTILKGQPSSFTLELPPYRRPRIGNVIIRSLLDRTLFVVGRAVTVAAPAGLLIWIFANVSINDITILTHCSSFLDPFAQLIGLDGIILLAFILGLPANEIVMPIIIMAYMSSGNIIDLSNLTSLKQLLTANNWTFITAVSTMLFSLMHWPCSTTLLTIKKETGSLKWTILSFLIPTITGFTVCFLFANTARLLMKFF